MGKKKSKAKNMSNIVKSTDEWTDVAAEGPKEDDFVTVDASEISDISSSAPINQKAVESVDMIDLDKDAHESVATQEYGVYHNRVTTIEGPSKNKKANDSLAKSKIKESETKPDMDEKVPWYMSVIEICQNRVHSLHNCFVHSAA